MLSTALLILVAALNLVPGVVALASNPAQDPKLVAQAIARVIAMPAGKRPARTIVDHMGMGAAVAPYNEMFAAVTSGLYKAFHIEDMLTLKP